MHWLQWLSNGGLLSCGSTSVDHPQLREEPDHCHNVYSSPRIFDNPFGSLNSYSFVHMTNVSRHVAEETAILLQQLRCSSHLEQQATRHGFNKTRVDWFDPSVAGSVSPADIRILSSFLHNTLVNHANFFAAVLGRFSSTRLGQQAEGGTQAGLVE